MTYRAFDLCSHTKLPMVIFNFCCFTTRVGTRWQALFVLESSWNVMAHVDAREGKWRGNWRVEWVASILHTTSEHGGSSITTADAHTSTAISRLNWRPCRFKWTRPFRRKTKSGFCACHHISNAVYVVRHCLSILRVESEEPKHTTVTVPAVGIWCVEYKTVFCTIHFLHQAANIPSYSQIME